MSPAHVVEPTYARLKQLLMAGHWPMGTRLEAVRLADDFGVSMTPVRDCLNRLVGEHLVDQWPGEGFRVARLSERTLRDMLEFNAALLVFAVHIAPPLARQWPSGREAEDHPRRVARLFDVMANCGNNSALIAAVASLNDRLHAVRLIDPDLFPDADAEIAALEREFRSGADSEVLRRGIIGYHERRKAEVPRIIQRLERPRN
jgi:DNA-binding GntR family transcriptional regulator